MTYNRRRRTTDSRRDEFYARRSGTTRRHCRHNADASTPSPTTPSSHLPRPKTVGRTRAPCMCRCAGESRRVRSGTTDDRRATRLNVIFLSNQSLRGLRAHMVVIAPCCLRLTSRVALLRWTKPTLCLHGFKTKIIRANFTS